MTVQTVKWFGVVNNKAKRQQWQKQLQKGRQAKDSETKWTMGSNVVVSFQPLDETQSRHCFSQQVITYTNTRRIRGRHPEICKKNQLGSPTLRQSKPLSSVPVPVPLPFEQITKDTDVRFLTGFKNTATFKFVFVHFNRKAEHMRYWKGMKQTEKEKPPVDAYTRPGDYHRSGPSRKLTLEQEFLMVMMRLRLGLLVQDLTFRFQVSTGHISQVFTTCIKLMTKELKWLIENSMRGLLFNLMSPDGWICSRKSVL